MTDHRFHPLVAAGSMLSGVGALTEGYVPMLVGFALTLLGLWLQRCEHERHERAMASIRPAFRPDPPEALPKR